MSTYDTGSSVDQSADAGDMKERAVESVAEVDAGAMYVAGVAGEEIGSVAHDVKDAARGFFEETRVQLADQASSQQQRAAGALRGTGEELEAMAAGANGSSGMATTAVRALGQHSRRAADWLEQREPADVVREVRGFARRHTGAFLVIALGVGIVAGRLTRALMADAHGSGATTGAAAGHLPSRTAGQTGAAVVGPGGGTGASTAASAESTPIADALADQGTALPPAAGTPGAAAGTQAPSPTGSMAQDQWAPSGEAGR